VERQGGRWLSRNSLGGDLQLPRSATRCIAVVLARAGGAGASALPHYRWETGGQTATFLALKDGLSATLCCRRGETMGHGPILLVQLPQHPLVERPSRHASTSSSRTLKGDILLVHVGLRSTSVGLTHRRLSSTLYPAGSVLLHLTHVGFLHRRPFSTLHLTGSDLLHRGVIPVEHVGLGVQWREYHVASSAFK
jgi:hypothetical protein